MIRNYIKIAFRNLLRDRVFSLLNLVGLAVGLASVIMIMAYVRYELSYDKSYSSHALVYRLMQDKKVNGTNEFTIHTPEGLAQTFKKEFPQIDSYTQIGLNQLELHYHGELIDLNDIQGDASFFKVFNFSFLMGDPKTALAAPGSMVLTESIAKKFFPAGNAIGSTFTDNRKVIWHITGVIKNIPASTHFTGDAVTTLAGDDYANQPLNWQAYTSMPQYVLLNKNIDPAKLQARFQAIYKKYGFPQNIAIRLQPVADIHLHSHCEDELSPNSDIKYIYIFSSVAVLILFIACINYVNLTTARSLHRAREIGLRKVLGAMKQQLVAQFLTESLLFFLCSTVLSVLIAYAVWPIFSAKITAYQQVLPLFNRYTVTGIVLVFVIGGVLSGAYPAFFLSSLQPVKVLKGLSKYGINISIRKALVVVQFAISGVLIVSTLVVYQQLNYISNARLGFNKDNLIMASFWLGVNNVEVFKHELMKDDAVKSITLAGWNIGKSYGSWSTIPDKKDSTKELKFNFIDADPDFVKTMGMHIVAGRNFSQGYANDVINLGELFSKHLSPVDFERVMASKSLILNEQTVKLLGLKSPVGTVLRSGAVHGTVIGVVQDFNGLSLHEKIPAVALRCQLNNGNEFGQLFIRISPNNSQKTIDYITGQWKKFYPGRRFDFVFADDRLQQLYTADKRLGTLFGVFSSLAILIACLGLFGLISLTVQNRVKEIGVRKVLGASVLDITSLISVDFIKLVFVSFLISSPVAWYLMNNWLQTFAYRIDIHWWVFVLACGIAIIISLATLSYQSIKAAVANPVNSLRNE